MPEFFPQTREGGRGKGSNEDRSASAEPFSKTKAEIHFHGTPLPCPRPCSQPRESNNPSGAYKSREFSSFRISAHRSIFPYRNERDRLVDEFDEERRVGFPRAGKVFLSFFFFSFFLVNSSSFVAACLKVSGATSICKFKKKYCYISFQISLKKSIIISSFRYYYIFLERYISFKKKYYYISIQISFKEKYYYICIQIFFWSNVDIKVLKKSIIISSFKNNYIFLERLYISFKKKYYYIFIQISSWSNINIKV